MVECVDGRGGLVFTLRTLTNYSAQYCMSTELFAAFSFFHSAAPSTSIRSLYFFRTIRPLYPRQEKKPYFILNGYSVSPNPPL